MMLCVPGCYRCCPLDIDTSQGGGKVWSNFRRVCFVFAKSKCLDVFIIVIIFLSSIGMVNSNAIRHADNSFPFPVTAKS